MPTVYITEFSGVGAQGGALAVANTPGIASQTVAVGVGSVQCAAFNTNTKMIRVHTDAVCSVAIGGLNPTAVATEMRFAANQTEYFWVSPGHKLAVITNT